MGGIGASPPLRGRRGYLSRSDSEGVKAWRVCDPSDRHWPGAWPMRRWVVERWSRHGSVAALPEVMASAANKVSAGSLLRPEPPALSKGCGQAQLVQQPGIPTGQAGMPMHQSVRDVSGPYPLRPGGRNYWCQMLLGRSMAAAATTTRGPRRSGSMAGVDRLPGSTMSRSSRDLAPGSRAWAGSATASCVPANGLV